MQAVVRRKLSMAGQALAFERAHPSTDPSHQVVVTRLAALVGRVDEVFTQERLGTVGERAAARYRRRIRRTLRMRMRHLVHVGMVAAADHPHLAGKFVQPSSGCPNRVFLGTAKALVLEATAHHDALLDNGLGSAFLADFTDAIAAFERASIAIDTGRRDHVAARVDFTELATSAVAIVRLLHGLNTARFAREPEVLAAWGSARQAGHPKRRRGVVRHLERNEGSPVAARSHSAVIPSEARDLHATHARYRVPVALAPMEISRCARDDWEVHAA